MFGEGHRRSEDGDAVGADVGAEVGGIRAHEMLAPDASFPDAQNVSPPEAQEVSLAQLGHVTVA